MLIRGYSSNRGTPAGRECVRVTGVIVGSASVAALAPLLRSCSRPNDLSPDQTAGFAAIVRGTRVGALGGAALIAFAALLATIDVRREH